MYESDLRSNDRALVVFQIGVSAVGARLVRVRVTLVRTWWRGIVRTEDGVLVGTVRCCFIAQFQIGDLESAAPLNVVPAANDFQRLLRIGHDGFHLTSMVTVAVDVHERRVETFVDIEGRMAQLRKERAR